MIAPWSETTARGRERLGHQVHVQWATRARKRWVDALEDARFNDVPVISGRGSFVVRNTVSHQLEDLNFHAIQSELNQNQVAYETVDASDVPGLAPSPLARPHGVLHIPDELTLDTTALHGWSLERLGRFPNVTVVPRAARPLVREDQLIGVETSDGEVTTAAHVVIAAGVASRQILPPSIRNLIPPLLPGAGGAIVLEGRRARGVRSCIRTPNRAFACGLHVLPTGQDHLYVGATNNVLSEPWVRLSMSDVEFLARCARTQINTQLAASGIAEVRAANRPIPFDLLPIVGMTPIEGLWLMTGTYRDGLTMAPELADAIVVEILHGTPALPPAWTPARSPSITTPRSETVEDTVMHHLAVLAEHELDPGVAGLHGQMAEFFRRDTEDAYDAWGGHAVPPEVLAFISPATELGREILSYLDGWADR